MQICLDPGHGGDEHIPEYKIGPTGVREAEINLRVALHLREFLEEAGAEVILTRDSDYFVSLEERAEIANRNQVDISISLHHNASPNPERNYASTWYHSDADYSPVSLDLARYIQQNLTEILRLPDHIPTGLLSDLLIYPMGFGVLRRLKVPGILIETSFYSNPKEEKLLSKPEYNKLEAWSHFIAICQWAAAGFPDAILCSPHPDTTIAEKQPVIKLAVKDGLHERETSWMLEREQIWSRSITLFLDETIVPHRFLGKENTIIYQPPEPLSNGWHTVWAEIVNYWGNHNIPRRRNFRIAPPATQIIVNPWFFTIPADGKSITGICATALDSDREPIADNDTITVTTNYGTLLKSALPTSNGECTFYLRSEANPGIANVTFTSGNATETLKLNFTSKGTTLLEGRVYSSNDSLPLSEVIIDLEPGSLQSLSNKDGFFFFKDLSPGNYALAFSKNGYWGAFSNRLINEGKSSQIKSQLNEIANGIFRNYILVLDPRYGGIEKGFQIKDNLYSKDLNVMLAKAISNIFTTAGAEVYLLHEGDTTLSVERRVDISNILSDGGFYVRLDFGEWRNYKPLLEGGYYHGNEIGKNILQNLDSLLFCNIGFDPASKISASVEHEIRATTRYAISIGLNLIKYPSPEFDIFSKSNIHNLAYQIYQAFALKIGGKQLPQSRLTAKVFHKNSPVPDSYVTLQRGFSLYTDKNGRCTFEFLNPGEYSLTVIHPELGTKSLKIFIEGNNLVQIELP